MSGESNDVDPLAVAMLVQGKRARQDAQMTADLQSQTLNVVKSQNSTQKFVVIVIASVIFTYLTWMAKRVFRVKNKYVDLIAFIDEMYYAGDFTLCKGLWLAWCAEYPNYTGVLASTILNRNLPAAIVIAYTTEPYATAFMADPKTYITWMEYYSKDHGDADAKAIVCGAWGEDAEVDDCLEPCDVPSSYGGADYAMDTVQPAVSGAFMGSAVGGPIGAVVGAIMGLLLGVGQAQNNKKKQKQECLDSNVHCRSDTRNDCG